MLKGKIDDDNVSEVNGIKVKKKSFWLYHMVNA